MKIPNLIKERLGNEGKIPDNLPVPSLSETQMSIRDETVLSLDQKHYHQCCPALAII